MESPHSMRGPSPEASGEARGPEGDDSNMGTVPTSGPEATSSQGKFTPGPWHVETVYDEGTSIAVRESAYGLFIAMVEPHDMEHADAFANARLIAAAPDLLAALEAITEAFNGTDPKCGCDTALGSREQAGLHHESCRIRKLVDARVAIAKAQP